MNQALPMLCLTLLAATAARAEDFVTREGNHFIADDRPFYYAGANNFYLGYFHQDESYRPMIDEVMGEARAMGLSVMRTWAFNDGGANSDGYPESWALQTSPGVYNEAAFVGLDYVLYKAQSLGMRVSLSLVNNWDAYGGMNWYNAHSPTATWHDEFYTDPTTRQWYKDHVTTVLNRINTFTGEAYKNDPTIFSWELANEPRASAATGAALHAWLAEMSAFVKSQDPNHMVATGLEGFYTNRGPEWFNNGFTGTDFIRDNALPDIDYATLHIYPDAWSWDLNQTLAWLEQHIQDADTLLDKPLVLDEFGKFLPAADRDAWFQAILNAVYSAASQGRAIAGSDFWMLEADASGHNDGFGIRSPDDASTLAIISAHAARMNGLASIPEHSTLTLLGISLVALALLKHRR